VQIARFTLNGSDPVVKIDGQNRSDAEQSLACLNCTLHLSALKGFQCNPILREVAEAIRAELREIGIQIRELKLRLTPEVDVIGVATAAFGRNIPEIALGAELEEPVERCRLDLHLEAEAKPDHLHAAVTRALNHVWSVFPQIFVRLDEMRHFGATQSSGTESIAIG
jgi:hypothetical protein